MMKFTGWEKCSFSDYEGCCEKKRFFLIIDRVIIIYM